MKPNAVLGVSSDQHLLNPNLSVDRILEALVTAFPDSDRSSEMDMLLYNGDFWNHEVSRSHPDVHKIDNYIGWRLNQAKKHNYAVRVLRGTETHDRDQCRIWSSFHEAIDPSIDFRYVEKVEIEHHPVMGSILYVPDNWKPTTDEVWEDVCAVLAQHNLKQVDWVFIHGGFDFLIPKHLHKVFQHHKSSRYQSICRKKVICGHIHKAGSNGCINSPGSIERLCHGEEEPKGSLRIECSPKEDKVIFQENLKARLAVTWNYNHEFDETSIMADIVDRVSAIPDVDLLTDAAIRLVTPKGGFIHRNMKNLIKVFPHIKFTTLDPKVTATVTEQVPTVGRYLDGKLEWGVNPNLTNANARDLLKKRIGACEDTLSAKVASLFKEK